MKNKRIEMKKPVKDIKARQAMFSKLQARLFRKAAELAMLSGGQVALVVRSPTGQPYSFGSPDVGTVTRRFLSQQVRLGPSDAAASDEVEEGNGEMKKGSEGGN